MAQIDITLIERDPELQSRVTTDDDTIEEYAEHLRSGKQLPDVIVFHDGLRYWLADGFHRVPAHVEAGLKVINATVLDGTRIQAAWYACGANTAHGLRRTNADKRRAVEQALKLRPDESDRSIAEHCGVSQTTVGKVRSQVSNLDTCGAPPKRIGKDGKAYNVEPSKPEGDPGAVEADEDFAWLNNDEDDGDEDAEDLPPEEEVDEVEERMKELAAPYESAVRDLVQIKKTMNAIAADSELGGYLALSITRIATDIDRLRGEIRQLTPVMPCGKCGGEGCSACQFTGFWTRQVERSRQEA
ncbi:MAG: ParB/RepB/Spo0J family partition protein [Planctomycetota bacterium]